MISSNNNNTSTDTINFDTGFQFTLKNHFRYYFLNKENSYSPTDNCMVEVGPFISPVHSPIHEATQAAKFIYQNYPHPIRLCLSGGVDSEAMAHCFLTADVPFQASIWRYNQGLNDYDIENAISFCKNHKIEYQIYDLNIFDFLESKEFLQIMYSSRCRSPQFAVHMKCIQSLSGTSLMPWQPPLIINSHENSPLSEKFILSIPDDRHFCYYRYFQQNNISCIPFFFFFTPNLFHSFLQVPIFKESLKKDFSLSKYDLKIKTYTQGGIPVTSKDSKWTGFEALSQVFQKRFATTNKNLFNLFFRQPFEGFFGFNQKTFNKLKATPRVPAPDHQPKSDND